MQNTFIIKADKSKSRLIKKLLKEMNVDFIVSTDRMYEKAFENKLKKSVESFEKGQYSVVTLDEIWK